MERIMKEEQEKYRTKTDAALKQKTQESMGLYGFILPVLGITNSKNKTKNPTKIGPQGIKNSSRVHNQHRSSSLGMRNRNLRSNNLTFTKEKQVTQRNLNDSDSFDLRAKSRESLK